MTQKISVGIPIYNESKNILSLIGDIYSQNHDGWKLENIIIYDDKSNDDSINKIKKLNLNTIKLIRGKKRSGKSHGLNMICKKSKSSILVIIDGDIRIKDKVTISKLIKPFSNSNKVGLTAGSGEPLYINSLAQKIANHGLYIWNYAKSHGANHDMYYCGGPVRALKREVYKKIKFPNTSADDVIAYFECRKLGYDFKYVKKASIRYSLPTNVGDLLKQYSRFDLSPKIQTELYGKNVVSSNFNITLVEKLTALLHGFVNNPYLTFLYLTLLTIAKAKNKLFHTQDLAAWDIATSTKLG